MSVHPPLQGWRFDDCSNTSCPWPRLTSPLMSAPASSSICTMASSPRTHAYISGVIPCARTHRKRFTRPELLLWSRHLPLKVERLIMFLQRSRSSIRPLGDGGWQSALGLKVSAKIRLQVNIDFFSHGKSWVTPAVSLWWFSALELQSWYNAERLGRESCRKNKPEEDLICASLLTTSLAVYERVWRRRFLHY